MPLSVIDWVFIGGYCIVAFGIGAYFSKRASRNITEFFIAGRKLPWWLAGTSLVATDFSVDAPLVTSGLVRKGGIYENWLWWSNLMAGMLGTFFYARLWRRAGVLTDNEYIELRYEGRPASALRAFGAVYKGLVYNCIIIGWVLLATTKVCDVLLGMDKEVAVAVLVIIALGYTVLSGFWGVVMTDFIQFAMAMTGSITLAGIVLWKMGGPLGMVQQIQNAPGFDPKVFHFVPALRAAGKLTVITFLVQVTVQWWGGAGSGGYGAQRLFACKNEKHAMLASLWACFASFVLRSWPWLIVGLASLVYFPLTEGEDPEMAYPKMIARFLPVGLRGLMVASLLAAFMSTMDTLLNWGASYLINDVYKRFIRTDASDRHYVNASRVAMLLVMALGALAAWQSESVASVWIYLTTLGAGGGILLLLRWYWWRINAWAEVSALLSSFVIANGNVVCKGLARLGLLPASAMPPIDWFYSTETYAIRLVFIVAVCTAIWVSVALLTRPVSEAHLERFYRRVRPGGWWGPIARKCPDVVPDRARKGWIGWSAGVVCVYTGLFGLGHVCLARPVQGIMLLLVSGASGWLMLACVPSAEIGAE
jgi:solute:Na+ symporter, SSS family